MNAQEMIGLCRTNDAGLAARWAEICMAGERRERQWVADLRAMGVKAAHPNDGWIKRDRNELHFCYPQFNDGAGVGDIVALGWPDDKPGKTRFVRLLERRPTIFHDFVYWHFEYVDVAVSE